MEDLQNDQLDMLVISTACHTAINRNVYKEFVSNGFSLVLVVPVELVFGSSVIKSDPPEDDDPPIEYLNQRGVNSRIARFGGIKNVLRKHNPRLIVLDNDPASIMALEVGLWANRNNSKLFCISCENLPLTIASAYKRRGLKGMPSAIFKRLILSITRKLTYGVFTINNEGTEIFRTERFKNVKQIPLGFDPRIFKIDQTSREKVRTKLQLEGFVIGFFGRVTYEKGIHILINALQYLTDYTWTLLIDKFDIYKTQYGENIYSKLNNTGLIERVKFINPKHIEMGEYINSVDVVVMPSVSTSVWIEQYGRIAAESMACGKCVIASNSGALPMLLGGHGILIEESNISALANILEKFINNGNSACPFTGEKIEAYANKKLSIKQQAAKMLTHFKDAKAL